jgi:hypothetical protein
MENPIKEIFYDLNEEQRCAIINLLLGVASYDGEMTEKEMNYLNQQVVILEISARKSMYYLEKDSIKGIVDNLRTLSDSQKGMVILMLWNITTIHGKPSNNTAMHMGLMLEEIGVSEELLNKTLAINKML